MASGWRKKQRKIFSTESSAGRWYLEHKTRCFKASEDFIWSLLALLWASLSSTSRVKSGFRFWSRLLHSSRHTFVHMGLEMSNFFSSWCSASAAFTAYRNVKLRCFHCELTKAINIYIKTTLDYSWEEERLWKEILFKHKALHKHTRAHAGCRETLADAWIHYHLLLLIPDSYSSGMFW